MTLLTVLGTRPEIIKMAPLIPRLRALGRHILVHSGQHYSIEMDQVFFKELELPPPDVALNVGSRPPVAQVAAIAEGVESALIAHKPDWVIVHGDTNTTLGAAIAASKYRPLGTRLAHVEAGCRSFDRMQAEELNRILVDQMADLLFAPTGADKRNLIAEGISPSRVLVTGNTVAESCLRMAAMIDGSPPQLPFQMQPGAYALATVHRQETVNSQVALSAVWESLNEIARELPIVLPLHPRTRGVIAERKLGLHASGLYLEAPVGYRNMIALLKHARFCLTDSGGLQQEAAILGIPAIVLRSHTEHRQYVEAGLHSLVGTNREAIVGEARKLLDDRELERRRRVRVETEKDVSTRILEGLTALETYR